MCLAQWSVLNLSGTAKRLRATTVHTWMRNSRNPVSIATVVSHLCQAKHTFLGCSGLFVRVLYQASTTYSCTIALTFLARWVSLASLSSWARLAEVEDLLGHQGLTSLARWVSLVVFLGHARQKSTVYFGTWALTSLARMSSLSSCFPELD